MWKNNKKKRRNCYKIIKKKENNKIAEKKKLKNGKLWKYKKSYEGREENCGKYTRWYLALVAVCSRQR